MCIRDSHKMSNSLNLPKTVPLLPGYQFSDPYKVNHHKTQQFNHYQGTICEKTQTINEKIDPDLIKTMQSMPSPSLQYGTRRPAQNDYIPRVQPPWLKYDRQVLCFHAYFQESVIEMRTENFRVRRCVIYYYLNDDTIYVTEPKVENSGIIQGVFIKRQKIPRALGQNGDYYHWKDFNVATNIKLFERVFRITECDSFTKGFYAARGINLNPPESSPSDSFVLQKSLKDLKINPPDTKEYKEYFEVKLGGGHPNNGLKQYLENDRKVLSFDVYWDDNSLEGTRNFYKLNFFLADNTVEVKETIKVNSGKDPFPLLLRRGKLPKKPVMTHYPGMSQAKEDFYTWQDLICGKTVLIYQRDCVIFDCDDFTRAWYADKGVQQNALVLKAEKAKRFWQPVPPYNGFGSEEDSLGSVYSLQPKPPKKDFNKMFTSDQFILRYNSRLISENREDNARRFVVSFFCGDDTLQVYEETDRNSGLWGGKFQERSKHINPVTNTYYVERDMALGETVKLGTFRFQLLRADEFTLKYMEDRPQSFPQAQVDYVLDKIRKAASAWTSLDSFFIDLVKNVDKNSNGFVEFKELCDGLNQMKIFLTYHEHSTLMRKYDLNGDGRLSVEAFYNALASGFQQSTSNNITQRGKEDDFCCCCCCIDVD
eukprot:TRINITY_DN4137_c0_g1_i8.p1 TRINITY_DN4137_c0_g1~~TRINITY_DN4137_c0_g1_i8.p1  ORF type:complete len:651 (+),score=231.66 TRINITY_DN4137_c0_g1_i8:95-2047(+)